MPTEPYIVLKPKRAAILTRYRHPWVFSMGLEKKPKLEPGSMVRVVDGEKHLGWAFYNPKNSIALRMISFDEEKPGPEFWRARIEAAARMRRQLLPASQSSYRLIHGEHDGFPGLTADVFGDTVVVQITTAGMDRLHEALAPMLAEITGATTVFERSEGPAREQDGLFPAKRFLVGSRSFPLDIEVNGFHWQLDPAGGQKTGFYLDQVANHGWVEARATGRDVLDLCCYAGGFTLAALRGGASRVRSVDVSSKAIRLLTDHLERNDLTGRHHETVEADIFTWLHTEPDHQFDLVILDPPALAKSVKNAKSALKAYSKLQAAAAKWVRPGGQLLTFSCSGVVTPSEFQQSVFLGLRMADREPLLIQRLGPTPDHPVNLRFPEGEYLKGLALCLP